MTDQHLSDGKLRPHQEWKFIMDALAGAIPDWLQNPPSPMRLAETLDRFSRALGEGADRGRMLGRKLSAAEDEALSGIIDFLSYESLRTKVARELGQGNVWQQPDEFRSPGPGADSLESWAPLGVLLHIAPSNAPGAGILSVMEGLLSGNVNLLKVSRADAGFSVDFFRCLFNFPGSAWLQGMVHVFALGRAKKQALRDLLDLADGVAVWGGEAAVKGVRGDLRPGCRLIEWGPRLSFALVTREMLTDRKMQRDLARSVVAFEQQTCTSPQCVLVEKMPWEALEQFAAELAEALHLEGQRKAFASSLSLQEQCEITNLTETCRQESLAGVRRVRVFASEDRKARVILEDERGLMASPLNRTLLVRPVELKDLVRNLRPHRNLLQTAGLACPRERLGELSSLLVRAGVLRITSVGGMADSYTGEPHDGVFALQRYSRRVSLRHPEVSGHLTLTPALETEAFGAVESAKVMSKSEFQTEKGNLKAHLHFKSGGSSGGAAVSPFTWDEYRYQMFYAAEGLLAAGLQPSRDVCMNLFYGGGLHGGFLSFFTILEYAGARQLPVGAEQDYSHVADLIIRFGVNCLLGMPGYLLALFRSQGGRLKKAGIEKIFYGGEPFTGEQRDWLTGDMGVRVIKSASYGSVDAGPVGYQCAFLEGRSHHLHHNLHHMEILKLDSDEAVSPGESGRIILTVRARESISLIRYDLGDIGRLHKNPCACGRRSPVFDLEGRRGDIFKAGGNFLNYQSVERILKEKAGLRSEFQLVLCQKNMCDLLSVVICGPDDPVLAQVVCQKLTEHYPDICEVKEEGLLSLDVRFVSSQESMMVSGTMKKQNVRDLRY